MDIEIETEPLISTDYALHTYDEEGCGTHDVKIEDVDTYEQFIDDNGIHDRISWIVKRENEDLKAPFQPIDRDLVIGVHRHEQQVAADSKIYGSKEGLDKNMDNVPSEQNQYKCHLFDYVKIKDVLQKSRRKKNLKEKIKAVKNLVDIGTIRNKTVNLYHQEKLEVMKVSSRLKSRKISALERIALNMERIADTLRSKE